MNFKKISFSFILIFLNFQNGLLTRSWDDDQWNFEPDSQVFRSRPRLDRRQPVVDNNNFASSISTRQTCTRNLVIPNGSKRIKDRGSFVRFRCDPGYTLFGTSMAVCVRNKWSHPIPVCVRPGCRNLVKPYGGLIRPLLGGAAAGFQCLPGFKMSGQNILICNGKTWNGTEPLCSRTTTIKVETTASNNEEEYYSVEEGSNENQLSITNNGPSSYTDDDLTLNSTTAIAPTTTKAIILNISSTTQPSNNVTQITSPPPSINTSSIPEIIIATKLTTTAPTLNLTTITSSTTIHSVPHFTTEKNLNTSETTTIVNHFTSTSTSTLSPTTIKIVTLQPTPTTVSTAPIILNKTTIADLTTTTKNPKNLTFSTPIIQNSSTIIATSSSTTTKKSTMPTTTTQKPTTTIKTTTRSPPPPTTTKAVTTITTTTTTRATTTRRTRPPINRRTTTKNAQNEVWKNLNMPKIMTTQLQNLTTTTPSTSTTTTKAPTLKTTKTNVFEYTFRNKSSNNNVGKLSKIDLDENFNEIRPLHKYYEEKQQAKKVYFIIGICVLVLIGSLAIILFATLFRYFWMHNVGISRARSYDLDARALADSADDFSSWSENRESDL